MTLELKKILKIFVIYPRFKIDFVWLINAQFQRLSQNNVLLNLTSVHDWLGHSTYIRQTENHFFVIFAVYHVVVLFGKWIFVVALVFVLKPAHVSSKCSE